MKINKEITPEQIVLKNQGSALAAAPTGSPTLAHKGEDTTAKAMLRFLAKGGKINRVG